jgi:23S rRNA (adenine2503-C2)-methyltransferase
MGMGEPLNNLKHVAAAVDVIGDHSCFNLGASRVTVSSVGPSPASIRVRTLKYSLVLQYLSVGTKISDERY